MASIILYCPHLNRDIRSILAQVPDPIILTGQKTEKGEDGCLEMHQRAVTLASMRGDDRVFVIEDDCRFTEEFHLSRWIADSIWGSLNGYGILIGGSVQVWNPRRVRNGLLSVNQFCSAHCIMYHKSAYSRVLGATQPMDQTLGSAILTYPFVAVQEPSFSGILQRGVNYLPEYANEEKRLSRVHG